VSAASGTMTITVRQAQLPDAALLSGLNAEVQALHAESFPERFKPPGPDTFPAGEVAMLLARPENLFFLAFADQWPAGYAYAEIVRRPETSLTHAYEAVHVHHLLVRGDRRRQGIGTTLLAAARDAGLERGIALLTLDVWSFNQEARSFSEKWFCSLHRTAVATVSAAGIEKSRSRFMAATSKAE
jgi:GNAT superfamily N-acetyltransferase